MKYLFLTVVLLCIHYGQAYQAAVLEHYAVKYDSVEETIKKNLDTYRTHVEQARDQGVEIVVFPEYGLTTREVDPEEYAVELTNDTYVIKELSAIAIEHKTYLVVNILEKVKEENRSTKYYNTNLVFDKEGKILAKYRKINLNNDEPKLTAGNETVTFNTDLNVKFGIVNSFDLLFYNPSRKILEDPTVTDVVVPSAWASAMPFFTSLSIQHGYSVANGINVLAASYGRAKEGFGGSGIYLATGRIAASYIDSSPSTKKLVSDVPKMYTRQIPTTCSSIIPHGLPIAGQGYNISDFKTINVFQASDYKFEDLDLSKETTITTICHGDFCCNFSITVVTTNTTEYYKLIAYDGLVTYDSREFNARICSLVACESSSKSSCGARINGTTKFSKITVDGKLRNNNETFYTPITVNSELNPLADTTYCENISGNTSHVQLATTRSQQNVLAFGILVRTNAASALTSSGLFFLLLLVIKFVL